MPSASQVLTRDVQRLAPKFDVEAFEVVIACVKAQESKDSTVWLNLHAPPSSGKTILLNAFPTRPLPGPNDPLVKDGILFIDSLTPRTLISGLANMHKPGLLEKIKSCSLLIKDLAPLASSNESRAIFSQLRRIFDGELSMPFGSGKSFQWNGRLTVICASISHLSSLDAELGARLLSISLQPMPFYDMLAKHKDDLKQTVAQVLQQLPKPKVTREMFRLTEPYAQAIATARMFIPRHWNEFDVHELPIEEQPHRLNEQLASLLSVLCELRQCNPDQALSTIERVAVESIPLYRRIVLGVVAQNLQGISLSGLTDCLRSNSKFKISNESIRRTVFDLAILQIIDDEGKLPTGGAPVAIVCPAWRWQHLKPIASRLSI